MLSFLTTINLLNKKKKKNLKRHSAELPVPSVSGRVTSARASLETVLPSAEQQQRAFGPVLGTVLGTV